MDRFQYRLDAPMEVPKHVNRRQSSTDTLQQLQLGKG